MRIAEEKTSAQSNPTFLSLNFGTALPFGDYHSKSATDAEAGFANAGFLVSFEGAYYIHKNIGVGTMVGYFNNPVDEDELLNILNNEIGFVPNYRASVDAGSWQNIFLGFAPYIGFGNEKISIDVKFLIGYMSSKIPVIKAEASSNDNTGYSVFVKSTQDSDSNGNIMIGGGLNGRIKLGNRTGILIGMNIFSAKQEFSLTTNVQQSETYSNGSTGNVSQTNVFTAKTTVSVFDLHAGVFMGF